MFNGVSELVTSGKHLVSPAHKAHVTATLHAPNGTDEGPSQEECLAQIERMVSSSLLQGSESLCKLLQYLAHHTLNFPADHLKEYQIATELLGRPADFDPQSDASVRVQIGRLRGKITEYYNSVGIHDPVLADLPKGKHTLSFERRTRLPTPPMESEVAPSSSEPKVVQRGRRTEFFLLAVLTTALLIFGILVYVLRHPAASSPKQAAADHLPSAFRIFWSPLLHGPEEPFVVYANADFVGTADTGMRYFDASRDPRDQVTQHYTGVGEVMGVLELDRLFEQFSGARFHVKRSGLFTLDDARDNNLIFVGSPTENLTLNEIPNTREFVFRRLPAGPNHWQEAIVDLHPPAGKANLYLPTPQTRPMEEDYAVVALTHGLERPRWTLILAGISTVGTQAAVDYVCDRVSLEQLLHRLNVTSPAELKPFEALLRVKVANDVPLQSQLVELRKTDDAVNPQ